MRTKLTSRLSLLFVSFALLLALPAMAFADNTLSDGDDIVGFNDSNMAMGTVCSGVESSKTAPVKVTRSGSATSTNTFANSATVTVTATVTGAGLSAQMASPNTITLPSNWATAGNGALSDSVLSTVKVNSSVAGPGSGTVTYQATGNNSANPAATITREDTMNVTWTTSSCDTTAPDTGIIQGPSGTVNSSSTTFEFNSTEANSTFETRLDNGAWMPNGTATSKAYSNLTDGAHTFDVRATDAAGNVDLTPASRSWTVQTDSTPPVITKDVTGTLGLNGWYTSTVGVNWTVSDGESAISSQSGCDDFSVTSDQNSKTYTCSATSAGGTNSASVTIKRDATAPVVNDDGTTQTPNAAGWFKNAVLNSFSSSDATSGLADASKASFSVSSGTAEGSAVKINSGPVSDLAGNTNEGIDSAAFKIDMTNPTINGSASPAANTNGWNNTDVTVRFECSDATSGVPAGNCPANVVLSEGADQSVTRSVTDAAGNTASDTVSNIDIDKTAPSVVLNGGPVNGQSYYFGSVPSEPTCSASDGLSGLDGSCSVSGYSNAVGTHTVTATAKDKAGNTKSASSTYTVLAWTTKGFYAPVDMGIMNYAKGGATVPLKFEVFAGATELTSTSVVSAFTQKIGCNDTAGGDAIEEYSTGNTELRYDTTGGQFIFNWKTPKAPGSCYKVTMTTQDGLSIYAYFQLK